MCVYVERAGKFDKFLKIRMSKAILVEPLSSFASQNFLRNVVKQKSIYRNN